MPNWFDLNITAAANGAKKHATLKVTGIIGGSWFSDGTTARQFLQQLEMAGDVGTIEVLIDSPGGSISDGLTMYDALRAHSAMVTTNVIGTAASMASVLMLAGDVRQIAENGRVMVHRANGGVAGTHEEIQRYSQILKQFEDRIVGLYTERTAQSEKDVRAMMNTMVGTWLFGEQAVKKGFATVVTKGTKAAAFHREWSAHFDVLPAALFDSATASESTSTDILDMTPDQIKALLAAELKTALAEQGKTTTAEITALKTEMKADITNAMKPAIDEAMKPVNEQLGKLTALPDDLKKLTDRVERAENLIKSGVLRDAGGTKAATPGEGEEGDKPGTPKNEAELREAMNKAKTFAEKRELMNAFETAKKK